MNLLLFGIILFYIHKTAAVEYSIPSKATHVLFNQAAADDDDVFYAHVEVLSGKVSLGFAHAVEPLLAMPFGMTIEDFDQAHHRNQDQEYRVPWSTWPTDARRWFYMHHINEWRSDIDIGGDGWIVWCWIDGRWIRLRPGNTPAHRLIDQLTREYPDGTSISVHVPIPPERI